MAAHQEQARGTAEPSLNLKRTEFTVVHGGFGPTPVLLPIAENYEDIIEVFAREPPSY